MASDRAWLLAQHADLDKVFQGHVLEMMSYHASCEAEHYHFAYLQDRTHDLRWYGTQFRCEFGMPVLVPVEDITKVDQRRISAGFLPFEMEENRRQDLYGPISQHRD